MIMKKLLLAEILAIAVLSLTFAGGGGQRASSGGTVTLRFIDISPSPARQAYYTKVFAAFKAETGITVNYESVPWDDAANKLTVLGTSNSLPDVMTFWEGWLGQFIQADWIVPLEQYIAGTESSYTEAITKKLWPKQKQLYGGIYTVPDGLMVKGIYIRKDWAREKGLNLDPAKGWTYDEYFAAIRGFTDTAQRRYGVSYRGARGGFDPISVYLTGFTGGRFYDDQGNVLINSEECLEGFKKWTALYLDGQAPKDSINWGFTEMVDNFTGGLTATLLNDSEVAATCQASMQPDQWTVMPMPRSKDGKIYNTINAPYSYSISTHSKNPAAAWQLIEFLSRPDNSIEYCKMGGLIPIKNDVAGDPSYGETGPYSAFVKQLNDPNTVIPASFGPFNYTDMHQGMFHEEVQKYLLGQQDAKTALDNIAIELQARMKKYLADNPGYKVELPVTNF
jgi:multiple sugar transport system substrate-binding protein